MKNLKLFVVAVTLVLASCANFPPEPIHKIVDIQVGQEYVNRFLYEAALRGRPILIDNLVVKLVDDVGQPTNPDEEEDENDPIAHGIQSQASEYVGMCTTGAYTPGITLKIDYWKEANDTQKENLLFHELGHCILGLGHNKYKSVMYPSILDPDYYLENRKQLLDDLFKVVL